MTGLAFHRLFPSDLALVLRYYEQAGGSVLADRFMNSVEEALSSIALNPKAGHPVSDGLRRLNLATFPYHLLFRPGGTRTNILILRHHRRHPAAGMDRR